MLSVTCCLFPFRGSPAQNVLPEPLTLSAALAHAEKIGNPDIGLAQSDLALAEVGMERARALNTTSAYLSLVPRQAKRAGSISGDFFNDSFARIDLTKTLYDFGRSSLLRNIANTSIAEKTTLLELSRRNHQFAVLQLFLDVMLADRRYEIDNEEMTLAYLSYDRLREKRELFDEISEIDVAQAESIYRQVFARRTESELRQKHTRLQLALALGRPHDLPRDLVRPDLSNWTAREKPDYEHLLETALSTNPTVRALSDNLRAARDYAQDVGVNFRPRIYGGVEFTEYATVRASRDDARASVFLEIPLLNGKLKRIDQRQANIKLAQAELALMKAQSALRDELFGLVTHLLVNSAQKEAANAQEYYRDLYMDRSRTLYEMEVQTDLGDAQAKLLEAGWQNMRVEFSAAVTWAKIDILLAKPFDNP